MVLFTVTTSTTDKWFTDTSQLLNTTLVWYIKHTQGLLICIGYHGNTPNG